MQITLAQAYEGLVEAVTLKGRDYVDPNAERDGCIYMEGYEPACIVGHVFEWLGVLYELVDQEPVGYAKRYANGKGTCNQVPVNSIPGLEPGPAVDLLKLAQDVQDTGGTWGEALDVVDNWLSDEEVVDWLSDED